MKQKKITYDSMYVSRIIRERKFHQIRDWLIKLVDIDVLTELIPELDSIIAEEYKKAGTSTYLGPSKEYTDSITFISQCKTSGNVSVDDLISCAKSKSVNIFNIIPYFVDDEYEWGDVYKGLVAPHLESMSHDDSVLFVCGLREAYFMHSGKVSQVLTDAISKLHNDFMEDHMESDTVVSMRTLPLNNGIINVLVRSCEDDAFARFSDECISQGARSANTKYPLLKLKYRLGNIWTAYPSYLPANVRDPMVVIGYLFMVAKHDKPVAISENAYKALERISYEYGNADGDNVIEDIVSNIAEATEKNLNNVKFLIPFKDVRSENAQLTIGTSLKKVSHALNNNEGTLIDFKYLYDNYNMPGILSNDKLQQSFIRNGGRPRTLTKAHLGTTVNTYIYTADGLEVALNKSGIDDIVAILKDDELIDIILNDIVGKVYYYTVIDTIVRALVSGKVDITDKVKQLINKINIMYPVQEGDDRPSRLKIADLKYAALKRIHYSNVISNVPVANQGYNNIVQYAKIRKEYAPLYYGIDAGTVGIDRYMPIPLIDDLIDANPGYLGEIERESIALQMILRHS